jgi:hypothetical protein
MTYDYSASGWIDAVQKGTSQLESLGQGKPKKRVDSHKVSIVPTKICNVLLLLTTSSLLLVCLQNSCEIHRVQNKDLGVLYIVDSHKQSRLLLAVTGIGRNPPVF